VPLPYEWHYQPLASQISVKIKEADLIDLFRREVADGNSRATDIAEALGISKGYVSKLAKKGEAAGWLTIRNKGYLIDE
jgi:DNA-binding MarR family transcriptional regulator